MWPTLVDVQTAAGPIGIHPYVIFMVLAFSSAFLVIHLLSRRIGVNPDRLIPGYIAAAVGGMIGARLLYALAVDPIRTFSNPLSLFSGAGFAVYGGILGGIVGVGLFVYLAKLPFWRIADIATPGVVIGMGVGRFGCFFSGCCHGAVAPRGEHATALFADLFPGGQLWLSGVAPFVTAEFHSGAGNVVRSDLLGLPLYPTQLWSAFVLCAMAGLLVWAWTKRRFDGQIAALTLMIEPPTRILFESFRADHRGYLVSWPVSDAVAAWLPPGLAQAGSELGAVTTTGITTSSGIGLAMIVAGAVMWTVRRNTIRTVETPIEAGDGDLLEELT
jgi:phosphatidylglycerol---prolipoprotein diacylglyceryl transferase